MVVLIPVGTLTDVPVQFHFSVMARWPSQKTTHVDYGNIRPLRDITRDSEELYKRNHRRHAVLQVCVCVSSSVPKSFYFSAVHSSVIHQQGAHEHLQTAPKRVTKPRPVSEVPRLPRKTKVDVTKCHACYVKPSRKSAAAPRATNGTQAAPKRVTRPRPGVTSTMPGTQNEGGCHQVPHMKRRRMSPSATPATQVPRRHGRPTGPNGAQARHQTQASVRSTMPGTQNEGGCHQVPRLLRETTANVTKCPHTCHAKVPRRHGRPMGPKRRPSASPDPGQVS